VHLAITPGQAHDLTAARDLLDNSVAGSILLADKSYDADWFIDLVASHGGASNIPLHGRRKNGDRPFDRELYKLRNLIERCFNRLKHFRRIATRYEKTARNYLAITALAALRLHLRFESTA